jgi:hypothetical protein
MRRLDPVDTVGGTVRVQAGAITEAVHHHVAPHGLTWPVDFASKGSSTVGGNIATNAGGVKVIRYGLTRQWVLGLEVVLASGQVLELNASFIGQTVTEFRFTGGPVDTFTQGVAFLAGATFETIPTPGAGTLAALGLLVAAVGAVIAWTPAGWAADAAGGAAFHWQQLVPMFSLSTTSGMSSVFLVLQRAGLGAAIGACLAARKRVGAPVPGLWSAVAYATVLEVGQFVVPGRYPDITDVLITVAAAGLVLGLVERADRGPDELPAASDVALNSRARTGRF